MTRNRLVLFIALGVCVLATAIAAEDRPGVTVGAIEDTMRIVLPTSITVFGTRLHRDSVEFPFEKNRFSELLHTSGFALIQKGVYLAQDIYAEGFKREDIAIVIDGERYHNACPNRMDNPLARTNPLDMNTVLLEKTSIHDKPGLGGTVSYGREIPTATAQLRAGASTVLGAAPARDVAVSLTSHGHRLSAQYAEGGDYEDGAGSDFSDNYGYRDNVTYKMGDVGVSGVKGDVRYHAEIMYTNDVMFPYLMMDERDVVVLNSSISWRGHRLYATHTDHLMDNGLRRAPSLMETDARNLTVGLTGPSYEFVVRRWDADNKMVMPMTTIRNHIIPDLSSYSVAAWKRLSPGAFETWGRLGVGHTTIGDKDQIAFFTPLVNNAQDDRTFITYAAGAAYRYAVSREVSGSATVDVISEPPSPEQLYLAYRAPMGNPWWSGNPSLKAPVRAAIRSSVMGYGLKAELSGARVWNYVEQVRQSADGRMYRTYENVDAVLLTAALSGSWIWFDFNASYTHATNTGSDSALVEIAPLSVVSKIKVPVSRTISAFVRHTWNDAQTRIDPSLGESASPSWNRIDLGARIDLNQMSITLDIRNLTDELYYQHLSYARSPYSSGARLYEPGRTIGFSVLMAAGN